VTSMALLPTLTEHDRVRGPLGVRHALLVFTAPRSLFDRVEDTGAYGWALVTLLGLVMLLGYAEVQTGLIDRVVDEKTEKDLAELEESRLNLVDRIELKDRMESKRKEAVFAKTMTRIGVVALRPMYLLASFMLIASALYAMTALTGRKPEYHTLMSICVYAGFIELAAFVLQLGMMLYFKTTEIDTSLRALGPIGKLNPFAAIDPFRIWFWVLVAIGLTVTHQLSRRMAIATCSVMCVLAVGGRVALEYAVS
jgi:Yip1 domain